MSFEHLIVPECFFPLMRPYAWQPLQPIEPVQALPGMTWDPIRGELAEVAMERSHTRGTGDLLHLQKVSRKYGHTMKNKRSNKLKDIKFARCHLTHQI